ncbi:Carnitine monooxygenase reductase subunit [Streptomyces glaucescens]
MPTPKLRTVALVAGAALLARRALRRRIQASPLWPVPALDEPVSGRPRTRAPRLLVTAREEIADGVVQLRLEGHGLPRWEPGAHLDLVLPSGLVRQYSLCGDPEDTSSYTVAARLVPDGRGGSREVHEQVQEGTELEVRGPRNRFPLVAAESYVFVAGGIGITPILPMLRALPEDSAWRLLYGGRTRASMPFLEEVVKIGGDRVTVVAEDEEGLPDLDALFAEVPEGAAVYCCGPEGLMAAVQRQALGGLHVLPQQLQHLLREPGLRLVGPAGQQADGDVHDGVALGVRADDGVLGPAELRLARRRLRRRDVDRGRVQRLGEAGPVEVTGEAFGVVDGDLRHGHSCSRRRGSP